jgi:hypothetical protein
VGAALLYLEWRQLVNTWRGAAASPRRLVLYLILLLLALRFFVLGMGQGQGIRVPAALAPWLLVAVGLAVVGPWAFPSLAGLFAAPADRNFLVPFSDHARPLMARNFWYRLLRAMRSMLGLVYLVVFLSRAHGVTAVGVWLVPVAIIYTIPARVVAGAVAARRIPVAPLAMGAALAWVLWAVRLVLGASGPPVAVNPAVAHLPVLSTLMAGDPWPVAVLWMLLAVGLGAAGIWWGVPISTEDWRAVDRWALVAAAQRGDQDAREQWRQQFLQRLATGRGATARSHRFRARGPGAVVEMEAVSAIRQLTRTPWILAVGTLLAVGGGVFMAAVGLPGVGVWLAVMAYAGLLFTSVQSRVATVAHPIVRDPLVIGAPGSGYLYVLAEQVVGFGLQVLFWGGAVVVAMVGGLPWVWGDWALVLVAAGQFLVQALRVLYWTLFPTMFERQVMARLLSFVSAGLVIGVPLVPTLALGWPVGVPFTAVLAVGEAALLSLWTARRLKWGRGPAPALGEER